MENPGIDPGTSRKAGALPLELIPQSYFYPACFQRPRRL